MTSKIKIKITGLKIPCRFVSVAGDGAGAEAAKIGPAKSFKKDSNKIQLNNISVKKTVGVCGLN